MVQQLRWRSEWQLNSPADIQLNADGTLKFKGPIGDLTLPQDYLDFLRRSNGAALRDRGSWFKAEFKNGAELFEIEWLGSTRNLFLRTWGYYPTADSKTHLLPPTYVYIGYAEPGPIDVVLCVDVNQSKFGKVYGWKPGRDPWNSGDNKAGLGLVANSFNEFMNQLAHKERFF